MKVTAGASVISVMFSVVKGFHFCTFRSLFDVTISTPLLSLVKIQGEKWRHFLGPDCYGPARPSLGCSSCLGSRLWTPAGRLGELAVLGMLQPYATVSLWRPEAFCRIGQ